MKGAEKLPGFACPAACEMRAGDKVRCVQIVGIVGGALRAVGNARPEVARGLLELSVALLAAGEVTRTLATGAHALRCLRACPLFRHMLAWRIMLVYVRALPACGRCRRMGSLHGAWGLN
jgi:hypothetical protein